MSGLTHYTTVVFAGEGARMNREIGECASRIFEALHWDRVTSGHSLPIGLAASGRETYSIGHLFHVFGTEDEIRWFVDKSGTAKATLMEGGAVSAPLPVPEVPLGYVSLSRVRKDDLSPGAVARRRRRDEARIAAGKLTLTPEKLAGQASLAERRLQAAENLPFVVVQSTSTSDGARRTMPIYISAKLVDRQVSGTFSSYGLTKDGATVPVVEAP